MRDSSEVHRTLEVVAVVEGVARAQRAVDGLSVLLALVGTQNQPEIIG